MKHADRPLSPHLQIYRPQLTSVLSITHRLSGVLLSLGLILLTWGLCALASGTEAYATFAGFCGSAFGILLLLGGAAALCWHLSMGVKHLILDTGRGFEVSAADRLGKAATAAALLLTLIVWISVFI